MCYPLLRWLNVKKKKKKFKKKTIVSYVLKYMLFVVIDNRHTTSAHIRIKFPINFLTLKSRTGANRQITISKQNIEKR